ncbi:nucleotidyltransferase substrate binding protein [Nemorincola caseinilytica]|uniref:Nucleotidyltransferase substrate binding protein n=1 Tax=Nemorincola caseinilytica TaxID=2054315 RepID=A0ABP8NB79_9BACT
MTDNKDIRWLQRFSNYRKALARLSMFIQKKDLNELEEQGIIQAFEFTHELAWNVMKDHLSYQGIVNITGSRDATREAFANGLITDGEGWMEMIKSRNISSHSYEETIATETKDKIFGLYYVLFVTFEDKMHSLEDRRYEAAISTHI